MNSFKKVLILSTEQDMYGNFTKLPCLYPRGRIKIEIPAGSSLEIDIKQNKKNIVTNLYLLTEVR